MQATCSFYGKMLFYDTHQKNDIEKQYSGTSSFYTCFLPLWLCHWRSLSAIFLKRHARRFHHSF